MIRRLLADADLNRAVVSGVMRRAPYIDFRRAEEVPLEGLGDPDVLAAAAEDGRVLVSHDVSSMPFRFREFVRSRGSPGVILVPQALSIGNAIESILLISEACGEQDLANRPCLVPSLMMYGF